MQSKSEVREEKICNICYTNLHVNDKITIFVNNFANMLKYILYVIHIIARYKQIYT